MGKDDDIPDLFPGARAVAPPANRPVRPSAAPAAPAAADRAPASLDLAEGGPAPLDLADGSAGLDLEGADDENEGALEFDLLGATSRRADEMLRAPEPNGFPHPGAVEVLSVRQPASTQVPPLAVPAPRASLAPAPATATPAPALDDALDFALEATGLDGSLPVPSRSNHTARSSYPPPFAAPAGPATPAAARASVAPPQSFGGLAPTSVGNWDLDEELGIAPTMDLVVAVPTAAETSGDGPWPSGRTPEDERLAVLPEEVAVAAGFGPAPGTLLGAPLYFVRVLLGKRQVKGELERATRELERVESERDQMLAGLALELKPQLVDLERFSRLYLEVDKYDALIVERERSWAQADVQGAGALQDIDARLAQARALQDSASALLGEHRAIHTEVERLVRRARAQQSRLEIELRNVQELARQRAGEGGLMPHDLALRHVALEGELRAAQAAHTAQATEFKARSLELRQVEDAERRARADAERIEGEREGRTMVHEGDMSSHAGLLEQARRGRTEELARAGRGVLELRGEVPVALALRRKLTQADRLVEVAAQRALLYRRALESADEQAYKSGRTFWFVLAGLFVLSVALLALR